MTGINVKIWNLENTIKNLTDQVKVLQKQNDAMKTDVKVASKTGIGFLWTITYGVYKNFPMAITTNRSSIMKLQKDSFQVRIMDLSESMSNYLRLSNNCCEKCLANTEISSRNGVKLYHIRSFPGPKFHDVHPLDDLWSSPCPRTVL